MNKYPFPENFLAAVSVEPGFNETTFINAHQLEEAPVSIRINQFKPALLETERRVPWCVNGYYLDTRPSFTHDPLFHAGCYYVQEASSMFIDHIFKQIKPNDTAIKVLDLCASPGGKSTLLNSAMNGNDLLVANEIIKTRVPPLTDNLNRWGTTNTIVTNNDPRDFSRLEGFFDVILVDAPCSGSGMFRKDPATTNEWSAANVNLCHQRQERILTDIYPALKEGGYLIYSTCSYSHAENEDILDWLCDTFEFESTRIPVENDWGIVETQSPLHKATGYRFYPGNLLGEGLFAACLKKTGETSVFTSFKNDGHQKLVASELDQVKNLINGPEKFYYFKVNDDWLAINYQHKESLHILQRNLYLKKSGIRVGKLAAKDFIPDHELALSLILKKDAFLQTPLSKEQAIQYLRKENMLLQVASVGWSLMTYEGHALGWAKLLLKRINNYYPKEIRILH